MAAERSVNAAEVIAFQISKIQILQAGSAEGAIRREEKLLTFGIVDQSAPFAVAIHLDNLMSWCHFAVSDEGWQRDEEGTVGGEGHPVRQRRKAFRINLRL